MSDLIERLRKTAAARAKATAHDDPNNYLLVVARLSREDADLMAEAAAEIERLRVEARENAMQALASMGQAQEAYEAQLEAEAELARVKADAALAQTPTDPGDGWTWNERLGWIGPDGKPADPRRRG